MTSKYSTIPSWLKITGMVAAGIALFALSYFIPKTHLTTSLANTDLANATIDPPIYEFGFLMDDYHVQKDTIRANQFLSDLLQPHKIDLQKIDRLARNAKEVFDVRKLQANKPYTLLSKDTSCGADYFIYEPNAYGYVVYDLRSETAKLVKREITKREVTTSGIVETSLWNAMTGSGMSYELSARLEDALAWSIDFHHIQKGDRFKLIYDEDLIDGKTVGIGDVKAAYYSTSGNEYYAIYFENDKHSGFYDLEGRPMKKAFLKAPVKYSRISSRFSRSRYHPVLKRRKAHLGTDYAAPHGTPIYAVADGVVVKRSYSRGNGKYVKIKHDDVYQTQYLHMSRFAKGVTRGTHVRQGQVIGYVGSTGLATGPHVCFRFWKNGRQVNHLRQNLPPPDPMPKEDLPRFEVVRDQYKAALDQIPFAQSPLVASKEKP